MGSFAELRRIEPVIGDAVALAVDIVDFVDFALSPAWRQRRIHEIDDVLRECHGLANDLLSAPNTS